MKSTFRILGIRADWKALAFCIIAASTFWFFNAMNHDYTVDIYYPIEIKYDDSRVVPIEPLPKVIKVNVTGYGWYLITKYLDFKTTPVVYLPGDLPQKSFVAATQLSPLLARQISDIQFNYIIKDTLFFKFDYLKEKKVKVVVDSVAVDLSPSYKMVSPIILSPDSVIFQGPSSFLAKVPDSIMVQITKGGIKDNFEETVKLPEQGYQKVDMLNKEVKVRFEVNKFAKQSVVVNVRLVNFPADSSRNDVDKNIILTYFVKEEDKNKVSEKDFLAYLDYNDLDPTDNTIGPRLVKKPLFVKDYYFTPYAVKVNNDR